MIRKDWGVLFTKNIYKKASGYRRVGLQYARTRGGGLFEVIYCGKYDLHACEMVAFNVYVWIGAHANDFFFRIKKGSTLWCYLDLVAGYGGGYGALNIDEYFQESSLEV